MKSTNFKGGKKTNKPGSLKEKGKPTKSNTGSKGPKKMAKNLKKAKPNRMARRPDTTE